MELTPIHSFRGQTITFTGKVLYLGEQVFRPRCSEMVMSRGAALVMPSMSKKVTLLVFGDLASHVVTDMMRQYSQKLLLADKYRRSGASLDIIDSLGFSELMAGRLAINLRLRVQGSDVLVLPS